MKLNRFCIFLFLFSAYSSILLSNSPMSYNFPPDNTATYSFHLKRTTNECDPQLLLIKSSRIIRPLGVSDFTFTTKVVPTKEQAANSLEFSIISGSSRISEGGGSSNSEKQDIVESFGNVQQPIKKTFSTSGTMIKNESILGDIQFESLSKEIQLNYSLIDLLTNIQIVCFPLKPLMAKETWSQTLQPSSYFDSSVVVDYAFIGFENFQSVKCIKISLNCRSTKDTSLVKVVTLSGTAWLDSSTGELISLESSGKLDPVYRMGNINFNCQIKRAKKSLTTFEKATTSQQNTVTIKKTNKNSQDTLTKQIEERTAARQKKFEALKARRDKIFKK